MRPSTYPSHRTPGWDRTGSTAPDGGAGPGEVVAIERHYDVVVIGSGFGGSVTALRLTEKGYRVGVLEAGRRWTDEDFANAGPRDAFWAPRLGMLGPMRLSTMGAMSLFSAVGVGGGSLIYANTLYEPHDAFYDDPSWAGITDWRAELAPYYDQAKRMLGATTNTRLWATDEVLREVAAELGAEETFRPTEVGVLFDDDHPDRVVPDPFFGGAGPDRRPCVHCARCTSGCPHNAKNTLPKNYLHLAEQAGARVHELTEVVDVRPLPGGGYEVTARTPGRRSPPRRFTADQVVLAAAARGTQLLLHRLRANGSLPQLSARVGELSRSNSEAIVAVVAPTARDFDRGVAITSSFHPEPHTHVELCHSSEAQDAMALINVPLTDGGPGRLRRFLAEQARHPVRFLRSRSTRDSSKRTVSLLVMQSLDNSLTSYVDRGRLRTRQGSGAPNPSWIPLAHDVARRYARRVGGQPMSLVADLLGKPATAHYIGGAVIGASAATGVVDPYHRVFGYDGLHVIDGSTIGANLGVNPSLTITAMAERAVALWPNKGDEDPRRPHCSSARRQSSEPTPDGASGPCAQRGTMNRPSASTAGSASATSGPIQALTVTFRPDSPAIRARIRTGPSGSGRT
jgi:cholesterol oxidase